MIVVVAGPIALVVTDLDGTLWGVDRIVHPAALAAIEQLGRWGVPVLAATARRSGPVRRMLGRNGLSMPAVLLDGALVRDGSWATIHFDAFDPPAAIAVLDVFRRHAVEPCIGVLADDEVDARLGERPSSHPDHVAYLADWSVRADLDAVVVDEIAQSFSVCGVARDVVQPVADDLATIAAPIVTWDATYGAHTLTVGPVGVHKWRGVRAFCAHHGLDDGAVLAVGDGLNDVELLHAEPGCSTYTSVCQRDAVEPAVEFRVLGWAELSRVAEIDRTERIEVLFDQRGTQLVAQRGNWSSPAWDPDGRGEHSVEAMRLALEHHVDSGGIAIGAFAGGRLAGIGVVVPHLRPGIAQLAFLHVSAPFRATGIGSGLAARLEQIARDAGDSDMVVSATPSENTVRFYLGRGFQPTAHPLAELFELEPEDVHLRKLL